MQEDKQHGMPAGGKAWQIPLGRKSGFPRKDEHAMDEVVCIPMKGQAAVGSAIRES